MNSLTGLSAKQLRRAADLKERIDTLQDELDVLLGASAVAAEAPAAPMKRKVSAAARAKMRRAQKERWARLKANNVAPAKAAPAAKAASKRKPKFSAAAKKRLSELAKARWAARKAAGKSKL
jgi:hypothetical protein